MYLVTKCNVPRDVLIFISEWSYLVEERCRDLLLPTGQGENQNGTAQSADFLSRGSVIYGTTDVKL